MYVVSGGGTGIGRAVATALHARGDRVLVTGRREPPLAAVTDTTGIAHLVCDHADPDDIARLAEAVDEPLDGIVHAAGGNPAIGRPEPGSLAAEAALLRETIDGNLTSAALTLTGLDDKLADDASIVLFGSIAAERGVGYYGPAKAAVASYAVGLAKALGTRGIRVNTVSPGYITDTEFFRDTMTPERAEWLRQQAATGRVGDLDDVVGTVLFLLSPASRHVTGQNLHLDGGAFTTR